MGTVECSYLVIISAVYSTAAIVVQLPYLKLIWFDDESLGNCFEELSM